MNNFKINPDAGEAMVNNSKSMLRNLDGSPLLVGGCYVFGFDNIEGYFVFDPIGMRGAWCGRAKDTFKTVEEAVDSLFDLRDLSTLT